MRFLTVITSVCLLISAGAQAAEQSSVQAGSCKQMVGAKQPFILVVKRGQEVMSAIQRCATDAQLNAATLSGIGALENPTLGFYRLDEGKYDRKQFKGIYELVSLLGNVTFRSGERFVHAHVNLGNRRYQEFGGHLFEAKVGVVAEIQITPLSYPVYRRYNKTVKLDTIQ
jgi:uncharacterized protein